MRRRNGWLDKLSRDKEMAQYFKLLTDRVLSYFIINDLRFKTNDSKIFDDLYLKHFQNKTITINRNISSATLTRYIKKYEEIVELLINNFKEFNLLKKYVQ